MIDPRPYTYEYRKPRLANPTYHSSSMYDSLYQLRFPSKHELPHPRQTKRTNDHQFKPPTKQMIPNFTNPQEYSQKYYQKYDLKASQPRNGPSHMRNQSVDLRDKYQPQRNTRNPSINKQTTPRQESRQYNNYSSNGVQSQLQNYGSNLMKSSQFNRFEVYQKQQKGFNIINCQPREMSNSLRVFPKLTLENKLIERGRYGPG